MRCTTTAGTHLHETAARASRVLVGSASSSSSSSTVAASPPPPAIA